MQKSKQAVDSEEENIKSDLANFLAENTQGFPKWVITKVASHCIEQARLYGFTTKQQFEKFALNMIRINPGFHNQTNIHKILSDTNLPLDERLSSIFSKTSDTDREQARVMTDAAKYWAKVLEVN